MSTKSNNIVPPPPPPIAAVLERPRRSTAGQRLSSLVGKAQEEDETFWSHSIWNEGGGGFSKKNEKKQPSGKKKKRQQHHRQRQSDEELEEVDDGSESEEEDSSTSSNNDNDSNDNDDDDDDGEGSYRISDEDSSMAEDQFDSDFDESESDNDIDENAMVVGEDGEMIMTMGVEEYELLAEEKRNAMILKRKKNQRFLSSAVLTGTIPQQQQQKQHAKKKKGKGTSASSSKRGPMGTGLNEGLILNWNNIPQYHHHHHHHSLSTPQLSTVLDNGKAAIVEHTLPLHCASSLTSSVTLPSLKSSSNLSKKSPELTMTTTTMTMEPNTIATTSTLSYIKPQPQPPPLPPPTLQTSVQPPKVSRKQEQLLQLQQSISERKKSQRQKFTQEELIVEAVQCTEINNAKWLLARQRSKEEASIIEKSNSASTTTAWNNTLHGNRKLISLFHSRRACTNTLTFVDMDYLPQCLIPRDPPPPHRRRRVTTYPSDVNATTNTMDFATVNTASTSAMTKNNELCIITGKIAKYRDPKSMLGFHDVEAYRELKRRFEGGEIRFPPHSSDDDKEHDAQDYYYTSEKKMQRKTMMIRDRATKTGRKSLGHVNDGAAENISTLLLPSSVPPPTINHFPFADDQPTMIAHRMTSSTISTTKPIRVMVTHKGVPVSPPPFLSSAAQLPPRSIVEEDTISNTIVLSNNSQELTTEAKLSVRGHTDIYSAESFANVVPSAPTTNEAVVYHQEEKEIIPTEPTHAMMIVSAAHSSEEEEDPTRKTTSSSSQQPSSFSSSSSSSHHFRFVDVDANNAETAIIST